ncbi:MAG TPA: type II secretion system F family protein [Herpetosiphonaceae bacterium]
MNAMLLIIIILAVVVALGLFLVVRLMGQPAANVDQRLAQFTGAETSNQPAPDLRARVDAAVTKTERGSRISRDLARADLKLTAGEFVMLKFAGAGVTALIAAWLSTQLLGGWSLTFALGGLIFGAVIGSFLPDLYVKRRSKKRIKKFNNSLADTIAMLASSLRSGYSLLQSMDLVSKEGAGPVASEFRRVVQEVGLGLSTETALANLLRRVPSDDLDLMITAINIQHEVGGNLAQILESIAHTIRERVRIKGEIQTLTAQGRISGYVITGLPVGLAIFLSVINPGYMAPMFRLGLPPEAWCCLPVTSGIMIIMGYFAIMKIVDIDI